jgi:hypothetical protein
MHFVQLQSGGGAGRVAVAPRERASIREKQGLVLQQRQRKSVKEAGEGTGVGQGGLVGAPHGDGDGSALLEGTQRRSCRAGRRSCW